MDTYTERMLAPDEREQKLPNWARDKMGALRRAVESANNAAEEARLSTSPDESDTAIERFSRGKIGLGRGTTIRFSLGERWDQHIDVRVDAARGRLVVIGGDQIVVKPQSGNSLEILVTR